MRRLRGDQNRRWPVGSGACYVPGISEVPEVFMIAFLGMGLLGSNFVRAMRRRGEAVQVWNRNAERARALLNTGASVASEPADAVRGAARVHLTLSDDRAVDDVLER